MHMHRWRRAGRGFARRAVLFFVAFWVLVATGCAATVWLVGILSGTGTAPTPALWIPVALAFVFLFSMLPVLRLVAVPLRDLIDAAQRVERGDLSPRVRPRGPRELRALARAFNAMLGRLEGAEAQRRRLLADVTHELRTPVAVLQGNLEALLDGVYPADQEHLKPLLEETQVLSRLIDDLRTVSLAESGALKLHRESTDLSVLLGDLVASFRTEAEAVGVSLESDTSEDLPLVEVDPLRLREVLANLVANALRHTPSGGLVRLSASVADGELRLAVSDTGVGISPEDLPLIFERFYKSPDSRGSGLGLAIARNLVLAHGGRIEAESPSRDGTTIRITIPFEAGPPA